MHLKETSYISTKETNIVIKRLISFEIDVQTFKFKKSHCLRLELRLSR